jgi:hypothetical protein
MEMMEKSNRRRLLPLAMTGLALAFVLPEEIL